MKVALMTVSAAALSAALLTAAPVSAQTATAANSQVPDANAPGGQEIVVTALRRDSTVSRTPAAITAVSGAQLTAEGVTNARDLQNVVPNLNNSVVGFSIRGVSSSDFTPKGDSATSFNVNNVYIARFAEQQLALFDVDRIEVLSGPQGTLYGRNATAGVVNVISTRPKFNFGLSGTAEYGNYSTERGTLVLNAPINDTIALRLAGAVNHHDGFTPTRDGTHKLDDQMDYGVRASVLFNITPTTNFLLIGDYGKIDQNGPASIAAARALAQNGDHSLRYALPYDNNHYLLEAGGVSGELNSDLGFAKLTYIGAARKSYLNTLTSKNDVTNHTQSDRVINIHHHSQVTQELRLASEAGGRLSWVVGGYYFHEREPYHDFLNLCCFFKATFGYQQISKAESYAGFGQATYEIIDHLRLTGGLRWTHDTKSRLGINSNDFNPAVDPTTGVTYAVAPYSLFAGQPINYIGYYPGGAAPAHKVTYKAQIEGDLGPNIIAFVKYETGYKAGSFNDGTPAIDSPSKPFVYQPETITDYEGGIKGTVFDRKLYFSLGVFHYDYKNHQVVAIAPTGGAFTYNAPAKITGGELNGWFRPIRSTEFHYNLAYLDTKYGHFAPNGVDFDGRDLDFAPHINARFGVTQNVPLANGGHLSGDVSVKYSSKYFVTDYINANSSYTQKGYTRTDLNVGYFAPKDLWYVQAFAENLENKRQLGVVEIGGFTLTDPRLYGVRAGFKF